LAQKARHLQGLVKAVEKTGEKKTDKDGIDWERCVFDIELVGFSKRTPEEVLPESLRGKRVKLVRWCAFDWHYKLGVRKTLETDETEAVLRKTPTDTVYW